MMFKSGSVGFVGLAFIVACSSTTSHGSQGGGSGAGDAGAASASGARDGSGATGDGSSGTRPSGGATGSGGADPAGGASALRADPTTAAGFCQDFYGVVADLFVKCWALSESEGQALLSDPALCHSFTASVDQHRISFDPSRGAACLNELKSVLTCDGSIAMASAPSCTLLMPLVPLGGTCSSSSELGPGHECEGDAFCQTSTSGACTGVCTARSPVGTPCDPLTTNVRCQTGTRCDATSKKCVESKPAAIGEACGGSGGGACGSGLWCDRGLSGTETAGVCRAKKTSGPCSSAEECESPNVCAGPAGAKSCAAPKAVGSSCTPGFKECNVVSHCTDSHECSDVAAALGEPCGRLPGEPAGCAPGTYCDGGLLGAGICAKPKAPGATCTGTSVGECDGNHGHCDAVSHTCVACP